MELKKYLKRLLVGTIVIFFLSLGVILIFIYPLTLDKAIEVLFKMLGGVFIFFALTGLRALIEDIGGTPRRKADIEIVTKKGVKAPKELVEKPLTRIE